MIHRIFAFAITIILATTTLGQVPPNKPATSTSNTNTSNNDKSNAPPPGQFVTPPYVPGKTSTNTSSAPMDGYANPLICTPVNR